jgi:hypothetical protein
MSEAARGNGGLVFSRLSDRLGDCKPQYLAGCVELLFFTRETHRCQLIYQDNGVSALRWHLFVFCIKLPQDAAG